MKDDPERARERAREWYVQNKGYANSRSTAWYQANKERAREQHRAYKAKDPEKWSRYGRAWKLKKKYGIALADYDALLAKQGGVCAICQKPEVLHVDHDHATGAIRGLLCGSCNRAIGLLGDDADRLRRAAEYLSEGKSSTENP